MIVSHRVTEPCTCPCYIRGKSSCGCPIQNTCPQSRIHIKIGINIMTKYSFILKLIRYIRTEKVVVTRELGRSARLGEGVKYDLIPMNPTTFTSASVKSLQAHSCKQRWGVEAPQKHLPFPRPHSCSQPLQFHARCVCVIRTP